MASASFPFKLLPQWAISWFELSPDNTVKKWSIL